MPISVGYGPISSAMELAQQSGKGQDYWRRFAAGQQQLDRLDRQASQALQLRSQQAQEAMAMDRLRQQERQAQATLGQRQAETAALGKYRAAQETRAVSGEQRAVAGESRRGKEFEFRMEKGRQQMDLAGQREQRLIGQQEAKQARWHQSAEAKKLGGLIGQAAKAEDQARRNIKVYSTKDFMDQEVPKQGKEKEYTQAFVDLARATEARKAAQALYQQQLAQQAEPDLPQYGAEAAAQMQQQAPRPPEMVREENINNVVEQLLLAISEGKLGQSELMIFRTIRKYTNSLDPSITDEVIDRVKKGMTR